MMLFNIFLLFTALIILAKRTTVNYQIWFLFLKKKLFELVCVLKYGTIVPVSVVYQRVGARTIIVQYTVS